MVDDSSMQSVFFPLDPKKKKKPVAQFNNKYEALGNFEDKFSDTIKDNANEAKKDVLKQIFGSEKIFHKNSQGGDLQPGQELNFNQANAKQEENNKSMEKQANNLRPSIDYIGEILKAGEKQTSEESQEVKQEIQSLISELKGLAASVKQLDKQVTEAAGAKIVVAGKYHKSFFKFVLSVVSDAKSKIDNAGTWLSAMKGKQNKRQAGSKKKSNNYWDMEKKHGTNFSLSGERSVSNQVG